MGNDTIHDELVEENARLRGEVANLRKELADREHRSRHESDRYRMIFEAVQDAIFIFDPVTGRVVDANGEANRLDGCAVPGLWPRRLGERGTGVPPYSGADAIRHFRKAVTEGPQTFEWMDRDAQGNARWMEINLRLATLGGEDRVIAVVRDIAERKRVEDALRLNDARLHSVFDTIPFDVWLCDASGRYVVQNAAGRSNWADFHGKLPRETGLPEEVVRIFEENNGRAQAGEVVRGEVSYEIHGEKRDFYNVLAPIVIDGEHKGIVGVNVDITERRRAEEALRASEARLRSLVQGITDVITLQDKSGVITFESPSAGWILGYPPGYLIGRDPFTLMHPDDQARMRAIYARFLTHEQDISRPEFRMRHADGHWVQMEAAGRDCLGVPAVDGVLLISRDVTERRAMEDRLRQVQRLETVGQLAGGVAHDFNNLLTVILGNAELAAAYTDADQPAHEFIAQIERAAHRASELTAKLLAFARKQVFAPRPVRLRDIVNGAEPMLRQVIGENVGVTVDHDPDQDTVMADAGQIEQVLMNLAVNARDAMPSGGTLTIATRGVTLEPDSAELAEGAQPGRYVLLSVSDTGTGMDEDAMCHAFEPFYTTKDVGRGTGLGLATCHGIVRQHGGHIDLRSQPGSGTTVNAYLPALSATPEPAGARDCEPAAGGSETLLLVEDDKAVREMVSISLRTRGYTVVETRSPESAVEAARKLGDSIDLLVTDVAMPGMNGRQVAEEFARISPTSRILFMSGHAEDTEWREAIQERGFAFLQKPFTPDGLARAVREALDR